MLCSQFQQSSVSHGYVGNRSATFPLQLHEWEVDVVPTVHFSNHLGYGATRGSACIPEEVHDLLNALLQDNGIVYDAILTGFVPNHDIIQVIFDCVLAYKKDHPKVLWLLDPVMGDQGKMYVDTNVISTYKAMIPHAFAITPNAFEVEILTDIVIHTQMDAKRGLEKIYQLYGIQNAIITSFEVEESPGTLFCMGYSCEHGKPQLFLYQFPSLSGVFTGTGDLFSGLLLAKYREELDKRKHQQSDETKQTKRPTVLACAVGQVLSCMHTVLVNTKTYADEILLEDPKIASDEFLLSNARELRLIQSRTALLSKKSIYEAEFLPGFEEGEDV